jgi:glycerol kinase
MEQDSGIKLKALACRWWSLCNNNFLMQFQSDMLGVPVERPKITETTALGAAYLAGIAVGFYKKPNVNKQWKLDMQFKPQMLAAVRTKMYDGWKKAVQLTMGWSK